MIQVLQAHNKVTRSPFVLLGKSQMKQRCANQVFQLHLGQQKWQPVITHSNDNNLLSQVFLLSWITAPKASNYRNEGQYKVHLYCPLSHCVHLCVYKYVQSHESCPTLCDPMDCSPPGSSYSWDSPGKNTGVSCLPSSRGSSRPRDWTRISYVSCISRQVLYH